jgi:transmembrane sensor
MDHQGPEIDQQIASVLSGNSRPSDVEEIQNWQNLSEENKKIFVDSVKAWDNCPTPLLLPEREQDKRAVKDRIITQTAIQQKLDRVLFRALCVASILIVPIMIAVCWYIGKSDRLAEELVWNTVTAPRKHIAKFTMADGTEVWLNAGSALSFPTNDRTNIREVKLSGEGYFKVTKNTSKPFSVITQKATVKVLGTSFNMKAYPGEEYLVTTLEEGSIELFTQKSGSTSVRLRPGEQAIYDTNDGITEIVNVDAKQFIAWIGDKFLFKDADLKTIITELERLYDVKIYIKNPKLEKLRFRGMFSYDQDLLDAFETLRRSVKISYTIKGREVWLE